MLPPDEQDAIFRENLPVGASLLAALGATAGLFVKQDVSLVGLATGWESLSGFSAFAWTPNVAQRRTGDLRDGARSEPLIRVVERSSAFWRNLLGRRRAFDMAAVAASPRVGTFRPQLLSSPRDALCYPDALVFERPFRLSILGFQPVLYVRHNAYGYIGEVSAPLHALATELHVRAPSQRPSGAVLPVAAAVARAHAPGELWFVVRRSYAELVKSLEDKDNLRLQIYEPDDTAFERPVGEIARVFGGWAREIATVADSLVISFPPRATPVQRAALLGALLLVEHLPVADDPDDPRKLLIEQVRKAVFTLIIDELGKQVVKAGAHAKEAHRRGKGE